MAALAALEELKELRRYAAELDSSLPVGESCAELSAYLPEVFFFSDLLALTKAINPHENPRPTLIAILACLRELEFLMEPEEEDLPNATELASWIAKTIAPINTAPQQKDSPGSLPGYGGTQEDDPYDLVTKRLLPLIEPGIRALELLKEWFRPSLPTIFSTDTIITLISLSSEFESWSPPSESIWTDPISEDASSLLSEITSSLPQSRDAFLTDQILKSYLQPLFSRSRPATVTSTGRPAAFAQDELSREQGLPDDSRQTKPWKYLDLRAIPVLEWAVERAPHGDKQINWPLYIPPLLTLLDDSLTRVRARGLQITAAFLRKFPGADKLRETGLAKVFEEAIFPTLGYLPGLTPEEESLLLLGPGFDALLALAEKLGTPTTPSDSRAGGKDGGGEGGDREKRRVLDKILREGVLTGYFHCSEHPRIVEVLMRKMGGVVDALGVAAVKHLKDLVPVCKAVVTDPFAYARPDTMLAGVEAVEALIRNCWVRLGEGDGPWGDEVLGMCVVAWVQLGDADVKEQEEAYEVKEELREAVKMLAAVIKSGGGDLESKVRVLVEKEPALAELFDGLDDPREEGSES